MFIESNEVLLKLIPNTIYEVSGEDSLYDKISPWIDSEEAWLIENILGSYRSVKIEDMCKKIIAWRALSKAIPSIDLVLTPNGFGVVSTSEIAPASKERVAALQKSLVKSSDMAIIGLVGSLQQIEEWASSKQGVKYNLTLLVTPYFTEQNKDPDDDIIAHYGRMTATVMKIEDIIREYYIADEILSLAKEVTCGRYVEGISARTYGNLQRLALRLIEDEINLYSKITDNKIRKLRKEDVWEIAKSAMYIIKSDEYLSSMSSDKKTSENQSSDPKPIKGAYFF